MSNFDEAIEAIGVAQHLLLIGKSKLGKSDYVAQACLDGFTVIYVDKDNGMATLVHLLRDHPEARQRMFYFAPKRMSQFIEGFFTETIYRHNMRTNERMTYGDLKDDDRILEIIPSRIPHNIIFAVDSATSLANDIIADKAERMKIDILDIDKYTREIYGTVGHRMTQLMILMQNAPFHVILQAHPTSFERKEKPPGIVGDVTEKMMIIKETTEVPISTSMAHGETLGKYYNQIGHLIIDSANRRRLDFTTIKGRIGGGTPGGIDDPRGAYRFSKLFGHNRITASNDPDRPWTRETTGAALKAATPAGQAAAKKTEGLASGNVTQPAPVKTGGLNIGGRKV